MTASSLLKKNPKLHVGIIEPSSEHWYQPAWTLVGAGTYDYKNKKAHDRDHPCSSRLDKRQSNFI
ncbi:hypothetical protein [Lacinutrix sp. Hel_I_90]|uniref:hypothetical protein n=1 Tax=Lacinutrix sp. Hel_I_90 TaxID=1249999 RepID=UPI0026F3F596|nr:hypothetical protein [Lacinutrix sp. Hel_I_90]